MRKYILLSLLSPFLFAACGTTDENRAENDRLLAQVHNKTLYLSDMEGMFPSGTTAEDSMLTIEAFANRWVRDAVVMHEAEQNVPRDLNIDKLVRDYRSSLIRHHYEQSLLAEKMDSTVTQAEMEEFYEKNKEQYQLETPIVRCFFLKAKRNAPDLSRAREWWNSDNPTDLQLLKAWSATNAEVAYLSDSVWHRVNEMVSLMPNDVISERNVTNRTDFSQREGDYQYFFRVLDLVSKKEIAPLSYVEDQARKYILHRRQSKILEEYKTTMYETALRQKQIQIFK